MKKKTLTRKLVAIKIQTHRELKLLAAETGRNINCDLTDDVLMLGIEEFRRVKNFTHDVTCTGYSKAATR